MTKAEAKTIFLNRGYIEVDGGSYFDGNKWRESITVISEWLKEYKEPKTDVLDKIRAEISDIYCGPYCEDPLTSDEVREMALEIIDKYKEAILNGLL